jgi:hypothetical protein
MQLDEFLRFCFNKGEKCMITNTYSGVQVHGNEIS